ncbi:unnamed protein product [Anisakis simplex]|uniref:UDP-xylose and UDP-N-acetylglucosamine transporter (inferred by orthology to a human protein) n=1 Tax=Anisakis simplex TaxID=6269 RepID=A0A0M3KJZ3_ANISI|nr:unnamed protein product [Anisakis simplex]
MGNDIYNYMLKFCRSSPIELFHVKIPHMWALLFAACVMQWVCIRFVYRLNAEVRALTVTLVVTLRKFLSLLISILWFKNPFTIQHWIGAILVFSGTLAFADIWDKFSSKKELEKKSE